MRFLKKKRRENGGQRGESEGELEAVVGWGRCPRCIQVRLVAAGRSISPYSAWQIHRHKVKMKSFESNLQDNRLLLYPEVDQCWAGSDRPEERDIFLLHLLEGGHLRLTSSITETRAGQRSPRASISASMILLPVRTSSFLPAPLCLSLSLSKDRWKAYTKGSPTPLWEFIILHAEGGRDAERRSLGIPSTAGNFSEL